jgi:predicted TIM-barrel fold metal-dependent hydrolase
MEASAHYGKLYLDAKEFRPYFKKVSELGVPVCVHHTPLPVQYESIVFQANLRRLFGRCVDQATAVGREIFSDLFEEVPDLKLVHSMLGGGFFAFADLLAPKGSGVKEEMERFDMSASEKAREYLNRNLYFGISHAPVWGKAQIECAIKVLGADHVLFGGSYPVRREWLLKGVDFVQSLDVGEEEKAMVLGENAKKIFHLN